MWNYNTRHGPQKAGRKQMGNITTARAEYSENAHSGVSQTNEPKPTGTPKTQPNEKIPAEDSPLGERLPESISGMDVFRSKFKGGLLT
jgi:hypothetical protein